MVFLNQPLILLPQRHCCVSMVLHFSLQLFVLDDGPLGFLSHEQGYQIRVSARTNSIILLQDSDHQFH
jgi:hypothetical protein